MFDTSEKALARRDKKTAGNILSAMLNEVNAQTGKFIKPGAAVILKADIGYLLARI